VPSAKIAEALAEKRVEASANTQPNGVARGDTGLGAGSAAVDGTAVSTAPTSRDGAAGWIASLWQKFEVMPIALLLASLGVVALLLRAIAARPMRGAGRPEGVIEMLARYPVGRGQQIVLMRVGRRVIVTHQADRSMRTLMETSDADEVAELIAKAKSPGGDLFARLLDRKQREIDPFADAEMVDLTGDGGARGERVEQDAHGAHGERGAAASRATRASRASSLLRGSSR